MFRNQFKRLWYKSIIHAATHTSPEKAIKISEARAVETFNRASSELPYYREALKTRGLQGKRIANIREFKELVPLFDKHTIYNQDEVHTHLFSDANIDRIQSILLSSGSSGTFSFGLSSQKEAKANTEFLSILLDYYFQILSEKTLIINCLAQAVKLPSINAVSVEVGPRADSLIYLIRRLAPHFSQTILIGDNYFLKNALEDGAAEGLDYSRFKFHLIVGGVYLPEHLRRYMAQLLHIDLNDPKTGSIISSMGISEFGLNLFFGSKEIIGLRNLVKENPEVRAKILPAGYPPFMPMFFNYFPQGYFVEEVNREIVITNLSKDAHLPLIRYNTQDLGKIIPYRDLERILKEFNRTDLLPPFGSPLVLMYGKNDYFSYKEHQIYPQQIQRGLYKNPQVAALTTGNFRLSLEGMQARLEIQLKKDAAPTDTVKSHFQQAVLPELPVEIPVILYPYRQFPYGMELDYQKKFKYV